MRNTIFGMLGFLVIMLTSCTPGETTKILNGNESSLPDELKNLKIYSIETGRGKNIYVAVMNNKILSTSENGKNPTNVVNITDSYSYSKSDIISENDSIIVLRK